LNGKVSHLNIDARISLSHHIVMNTPTPLTLVLGSTGKTGSRVAAELRQRGMRIRTAARSNADVSFDSVRQGGVIISA
jgi:hypothetical protein